MVIELRQYLTPLNSTLTAGISLFKQLDLKLERFKFISTKL